MLWVTPRGGGLQAYLRELLRAFGGAADVRFAGIAVGPGEAPGGFATPVRVGMPGVPGWYNWQRFMRHLLVAARQADLAQIHGIYGAQFMLGAPLCWLLRLPYVVNPHNALAPWMLGQKALKKRLFFNTVGGFFLNRAACVLATSRIEADDLARRFPRARIRMVLAGTSVPERPQVEWLDAADCTSLRLLYLGSFDPWKRVPSLVRAVAALRVEGLDVRLTIAGAGPPRLERPVDEAIAQSGAASAITRVGYVSGEHKLELIRRSHLLVLPSATDSYSIATAEALSQGLPVVITEGAGAASDVRSHGAGTVVPVDNEPALAAALRRYTDPALLRESALNAHRYAREALDLPVLRSAMAALYRECARAGG